jgi:hypothetical protein
MTMTAIAPRAEPGPTAARATARPGPPPMAAVRVPSRAEPPTAVRVPSRAEPR